MRLQLLHKLLVLLLLSTLTMGIWSSCEKYNSESVGMAFFPSNSQVRNFTHPVYVEYTPEGVRVWGPYSHEVNASIDGSHVTLHNTSDSLALFVYGYPAAADSAAKTDGSLLIESQHDYALYLNKLILRSQHQPTLRSVGNAICYLVLPNKSETQLFALSASSTFSHDGTLVVTGDGTLSLSNNAASQHSSETSESDIPVALEVGGGLLCQYNAKLNFYCPDGDAIRISNGPFRSSLGTWTFEAGHNAVCNLSDSIVLIAGKYTGVAREGKFLANSIGAVIRRASIEGLAGQASDLLDTLILHQHYDSTFVCLQVQFDTITVEADSSLKVGRLGEETKPLVTLTTPYAMKAPWVLFASESLAATDTLSVIE